jgi:type IV fimbrial biogenesis protein FimT
MRQLMASRGPRTQRGLTLIELLVAFSIAALLMVAAVPSLSEYSVNSKLRESGNTLYTETLMAQSEAIKRNRNVRVSVSGSTITVADVTAPLTPVTLRTRSMADGVTAANASVQFGSQGWVSDLTAVSINLAISTATCSADNRCPGLRVEGGGAIKLCGNHLDTCP